MSDLALPVTLDASRPVDPPSAIVRGGTGSTIVVFGVFVYWVLFENVVFFFSGDLGGAALLLVTNALKLLLPFALLFVTGLPRMGVLVRGLSGLYIALFAAFLVWALVPTLVSGSVVDYIKFIPRFVFFLAALSLFDQRPAALTLFAKCVVVYVLIAPVQLALVYATQAWNGATLTPLGLMAGPFGLFGNISGRFYLPGVPVPIVRLAGFWNEPSNASAAAFAAFFLARWLSQSTGLARWRWCSRGCLVAGFLTLSNAGYLAIGAGMLFGLLFSGSNFTIRRALQIGVLLPLVLALGSLALIGRQFVLSNLSDNLVARAVAGVRGAEQIDDPTSGRGAMVTYAINSADSTVIGAGVQKWGIGGIPAPQNAPLLWLVLVGFPGLALLLARETLLVLAARRAALHVANARPVAQAFIVIMVQQLAYGSWMDATYFCFGAAILSLAVRMHNPDRGDAVRAHRSREASPA